MQSASSCRWDLQSSSMISTSEKAGSTTTGTVEFPAMVRLRLNLSVSSRSPSSMIVTSKHCLWVDGSEVNGTRGLLESVISV